MPNKSSDLARTLPAIPDRTLDRLQKNFYQSWRVLEDLRESPDPAALLNEWRHAEGPTQAWRHAQEHQQAITVISVALRLSRAETEQLVQEHVGASS